MWWRHTIEKSEPRNEAAYSGIFFRMTGADPLHGEREEDIELEGCLFSVQLFVPINAIFRPSEIVFILGRRRSGAGAYPGQRRAFRPKFSFADIDFLMPHAGP